MHYAFISQVFGTEAVPEVGLVFLMNEADAVVVQNASCNPCFYYIGVRSNIANPRMPT